MPRHASSRATDPAAAASALGQEIAAENSASTSTGQPVTLPTLAEARARLLEVIRQRPEPKPRPQYVTRADVARWEGAGRLRDAQRTLRLVRETSLVATALRIAPSTVRRWRAGTHAPNVRHWRQLSALRALIWRARP
jgi:hypothetical protein